MSGPVRVDWLNPITLFAPSDDNILAPVPMPAWILREFGRRLDMRRPKGLPLTGLALTPDRRGRMCGLRWSTDSDWGPPSVGAIETLLWLRHAFIIRRLPGFEIHDPSMRALASWREGLTVGGSQAQEVRAHLLTLSAVTSWHLSAKLARDELTQTDLEVWASKVGRVRIPTLMRQGRLLEVEMVGEADGTSRVKTHIKRIALDAELMEPDANEPLIWVAPHWHRDLPALGIRFLHRLLDPLPPAGWEDGAVAQTYPEMVQALGLVPEAADRVTKAHAGIDQAGKALVAAGWLDHWNAARMPRGDARVAHYHWAPSDQMIVHRTLATLPLKPLEYRDRVIPAALVRMGVPKLEVASWINQYSARRLRELLQYLIFRRAETKHEIRHPYAYLKNALAKHETMDGSDRFTAFVREQSRVFLPGMSEIVVLPTAARALVPGARALMLPPAPRPQLTAGTAAPAPADGDSDAPVDLTRQLMAFVAIHAPAEVSAPWTEEPTVWCAMKLPSGGLRIEVPVSLRERVHETPTLDNVMRKAAMKLTNHETFMIIAVEDVEQSASDFYVSPPGGP